MKENRVRESNYDLLRVIATIAVVMIHVSASYIYAMDNPDVFGEVYVKHISTTIFYNTVSRFAVPCFVMLSGAFILADEKTADYKYFYRKSFANVGIHAVIFSILYFLYFMIILMSGIIQRGASWTELFGPVKSLVRGEPFYHMWYLYMLAGVYLLAPVAVRFKNSVSEKNFSKTVWIFLILACLSERTSTHMFRWDIGSSFCYFSYFLAGYELRRMVLKKKDNRKGIFFIVLGFLTELVLACIQYDCTIKGMQGLEVGPWGPFIVVASVLIFYGFSCLSVRADIQRLSSHTFSIYLLHGGIWELFITAIRRSVGAHVDNRIVIPLFILLVFLISYIGAVCYRWLWRKIVSCRKQ